MRLEFVHIPKTGGQSIKASFPECQWYSKQTDKSTVAHKIPGYFDDSPRGTTARRCNFWHNHELISSLYDEGCRTFCVIRDPVDRIVSEYRWRKFPDDALIFNEILREWRHRIRHDPFMLDNHLAPQHLFAEQCDHVLKLDKDLEKSVNELVSRYGIAPRPLKHIASRPYRFVNRSVLDSNNMRWVRSYYAKDFELFGDDK